MQNNTDFNKPITNFLDGSLLTDRAKGLVEGDLYALAYNTYTPRVRDLTVRDLYSIEEARIKHELCGVTELTGSSCCCTCTPACCCTAVAVIKAA